MVVLRYVFAVLGLMIAFGACVPDDAAPVDPPVTPFFVEGYVDPALGSWVRVSVATPFASALETETRAKWVDDAAVTVFSDDGTTVQVLAPEGRGVYAAPPGGLRAGVAYALRVELPNATLATASATIPAAPQLAVDAPQRGTFGVDAWDVSARARVTFVEDFALRFSGDPATGLFAHPCNRIAPTFGYVSSRCADAFPEATLLLGFFESEAVDDSLRTAVTLVPEGYADYVSIAETNEFNWENDTFIYLDPLTVTGNVEGAYGYVSFQHSITVVVPIP